MILDRMVPEVVMHGAAHQLVKDFAPKVEQRVENWFGHLPDPLFPDNLHVDMPTKDIATGKKEHLGIGRLMNELIQLLPHPHQHSTTEKAPKNTHRLDFIA